MAKTMLRKSNWEAFRKAGMLWFVNRMLHIFGWALVFEFTDGGKLKDVYPSRTKFRGFCSKEEDKGFKNVSKFMVKNAGRLLKDCGS